MNEGARREEGNGNPNVRTNDAFSPDFNPGCTKEKYILSLWAFLPAAKRAGQDPLNGFTTLFAEDFKVL